MDKVKYISPENIRRMFNESQYPILIAEEEIIPQVLRDDHLKEPQKKGEPSCTHGQMIRYVDKAGQWVVEVFQYLRPNGTIGGSGKPDPKRLRIENTVYIVDPKAPS